MTDANWKCKYCGWALGFCAAVEYCTNPECSYVDGHYSGPRVIIPPSRTFTKAELEEAVRVAVDKERAIWREALEWSFHHAGVDDEATTGEQEDYNDWMDVIRVLLVGGTKDA